MLSPSELFHRSYSEGDQEKLLRPSAATKLLIPVPILTAPPGFLNLQQLLICLVELQSRKIS